METTDSDDAIATSLPRTCEERPKFDVDLLLNSCDWSRSDEMRDKRR
jgi:hypothetical protein